MSLPEMIETDSLGDGMVLPKGYINQTEKTFQYQNSLPSLPVPNLKQTLAKYLDSVRPLVSETEYKQTEAVVKKFQTGVGQELHQRLLQKADGKRNWVEDWWEEFAYLRMREPHAPFVNFAGPGPYLNTYWPPEIGTQLERASLATWFALKYWELVRKQRLQIDRGGKKTVWCMNQVHRMYNGCKTPGYEVDKLNHYFKTEEEGQCATYISIISNGHFYRAEILHKDGTILSAPELQVLLERVQKHSEAQSVGAGLGYLTADNRTTWAKLRDHLISIHPDNERHLLAIQNSIMTIVLDDRTPSNDLELTMEGLCGNPLNRWFDKTLQLVVFKNGTITCNGDHAPCDAMVLLTMSAWMYAGLLISKTWKGRNDIRPLDDPVELVFHLDPVILQGIDQAKQQYEITGSSIELHLDHYRNYGKNLIRKHKYHPDTFIQMALQLSYYRMYGKPAPTYETASTRKFWHGRTETVRSCTMESLNWTKAMLDPAISTKLKVTLLRSAMDKHLELMKEAMENEGCDRHLFGLQITALVDGLPTPDIFTDPSWTKSGGSGNFVLSTSFVGFTPCFGGVAPMVKDGYGVFYSIENECINMYVASWRADSTSSKAMYDNIAQSLNEMRLLIESNNTANL